MEDQLQEFFCDLHIHIGQAEKGEPVKITASRSLNFVNIAREAVTKKGLNLVGIIDCASPPVIRDIEKALKTGEMTELKKGGIGYKSLVIIPGAEVESREKNGGQAHYLAYFPSLENIKQFSQIMDQYITNINLSSQVTGLTGADILKIVDALEGILIPAHAFTPHKSFYGSCAASYREVFTDKEWAKIPAIELGLSADSFLAGRFGELSDKTFLSNSDAHSLPKIAREYNRIRMKELNFEEFSAALWQEAGRGVSENFGLDPRLGKYHRSFCPDCEFSSCGQKAVLICPECENEKLITGVLDRVLAITGDVHTEQEISPPYTHQVPLLDIPGIGPKTLTRLIDEFGSEMAVLHEAEEARLEKVAGRKLAEKIIRAREGDSKIKPGGGGRYGQVVG